MSNETDKPVTKSRVYIKFMVLMFLGLIPFSQITLGESGEADFIDLMWILSVGLVGVLMMFVRCEVCKTYFYTYDQQKHTGVISPKIFNQWDECPVCKVKRGL
ncbi:hypothetical protein [Kordiimonas sp. SCSIO 12610]|uniref:hypothetical protein n=1 Tax=Kordiimonas sp. SCSIO 12610 TaxID=2829597 RepID=UPI0021088D17|nr:hypothetical protein [Kordiimonas sp. SCSIO 12610]UTW56606.1 hypothetical protein KFF44_06835 [Kordiimonas sp. SCSIO 12610]